MINFLPWRQLRLEYECRVLTRIFVCVSIAAAFSIIISHNFINHKILFLKKDIFKINNEISTIIALTKKTDFNLQSKLDIDQSNYIITPNHLLNLLRSNDNVAVCFTAIEHSNNLFVFKGYANSPDDLLSFIKNWPTVKLFSEIQIKEFQQKNNTLQFRFLAIKA